MTLSSFCRLSRTTNKTEERSVQQKKQLVFQRPRTNQIKFSGVPPHLRYDFSRIQIHPNSEQATLHTHHQTKDDKITHPVVDPCPLSLTTPRACPFGGACHTCPTHIQSKLTVNQPEDPYEQEADIAAKEVVQMLKNYVLVGETNSVSAKPYAVPPIVHEALRSTSQPLDQATLTFLESRFGHDFNQVRIHTNTKAAESAQEVNALAYTFGNHIVFGEGMYDSGTHEGRRLLTHEASHVVQQRYGVRLQEGISKIDDPYERIADTVAERVIQGKSVADLLPKPQGKSLSRASSINLVQRAAPAVGIGALVAACIIGAIVGVLADITLGAIVHMWRKKSLSLRGFRLNYCALVLSAILGCLGGTVAKGWLEPYITKQLGTKLGGVAGTLIGKVLIFIVKKLGMGIPKGIVKKLLILGCISIEQANELTPGITNEITSLSNKEETQQKPVSTGP